MDKNRANRKSHVLVTTFESTSFSRLQMKEAQIRVALIDPLLQALDATSRTSSDRAAIPGVVHEKNLKFRGIKDRQIYAFRVGT
jgi:hypothetical protein